MDGYTELPDDVDEPIEDEETAELDHIPVIEGSLALDLLTLERVKRRIAELEDFKKELQERLGKEEDLVGTGKIVDHDGTVIKVTRSEPGQTTVNMDLLSMLVDEVTFNAVTKRKFDTEAFKRAVQAGRISPEDLERINDTAFTHSKKKPFFVFTRFEEVETDG